MKKIIIIGGTGFIGYHLCKKFIEIGWNVTSVSLRNFNKKRIIKYVNYIKCNIANYKDIKKKIIGDYDYVINLGGYVDHKNFNKTYLGQYVGAKNLIKFFLKKKIKLFIQIGSSAENAGINSPQKESITGKPRDFYGQLKLKITKYLLKKKKFNFVIVRLYQLYGPAQDENRILPILINASLNKKIFYRSRSNFCRDFLYIDDFVAAILKILKNKKILKKIINIGYGKPIELDDIIKIMKKKLGYLKIKFTEKTYRKDETKLIYPSVKRAKKLLKWKPIISFKKGLYRTISYYKKQKRIESIRNLI